MDTRWKIVDEQHRKLEAGVSTLVEQVTSYARALKENGEELQGIGDRVLANGEKLQEIGDRVGLNGEKLQEIGEKLQEIGDRVLENGEKLQEIGDRVLANGEKLQEIGDRVGLNGVMMQAVCKRIDATDAKMDLLRVEILEALGFWRPQGKGTPPAFSPHLGMDGPSIYPRRQCDLDAQVKLEFPAFNNENPRFWIRKCERYFAINGIEEARKLELASFHFDEEADTWYESWALQNPKATWGMFVEGVCHQFATLNIASIIEEFDHLKQSGSVIEYVQRFGELMLRKNLSLAERYFVFNFVGGLSDALKSLAPRHSPVTLGDAVEMAKLHEMALRAAFKAQNVRTTPPGTGSSLPVEMEIGLNGERIELTDFEDQTPEVRRLISLEVAKVDKDVDQPVGASSSNTPEADKKPEELVATGSPIAKGFPYSEGNYGVPRSLDERNSSLEAAGNLNDPDIGEMPLGMGKRVENKSCAPSNEKQAAASSPETAAEHINGSKSCPHFSKGFDLNALSEKIGSSGPCKCQDCCKGAADKRGGIGKVKHGKKKEKGSANASTAIWVCLQCGHYGCGGVGLPGTRHHAFRHHRQTCHPLVIQSKNSHLRWCFQCDKFFPFERVDENGDKRDALLDVVKLMKLQSLEKKSVDDEDALFGGGGSGVKTTDGYLVRGLINLGNTCFFNSVMQNLFAMDSLREYFLNEDASFGPLYMALKRLFSETRAYIGLRDAINPSSLFSCLCSKAPQFKGGQQHDSHELLLCLLDGLSIEELAVQSPASVNSLFGGRFSSTVSFECGHSSTNFEPFLDLSLHVPAKKPPAKRVQPATRDDTDAGLKRCVSEPSVNVESPEAKSVVSFGENASTSLVNNAKGSSVTLNENGDSDSDPNEVDDTDSPVSVGSCLLHFIKQELLINGGAWEYCDDCSSNVKRQVLEKERKHSKSRPGTSKCGGDTLISQSNPFPSKCEIEACTEDAKVLEETPLSTVCESCNQDKFGVDELCSSGEVTSNDQKCCEQSIEKCESRESEDRTATKPSEKINVKKDATKMVRIYEAPLILTVNLKRFSKDARGCFTKLKGHVKFGETLDLGPYMDARCIGEDQFMYRLLGVVEHSGTMTGGHYTAYVSREKRESSKAERGSKGWYLTDDALVREVSLEDVLRSEAYILFYERV